MKHSPLSQVANINIQFKKVWKGDGQNTKQRISDWFQGSTTCYIPADKCRTLLVEPAGTWGTWWIKYRSSETHKSQTQSEHYLKGHYLFVLLLSLKKKKSKASSVLASRSCLDKRRRDMKSLWKNLSFTLHTNVNDYSC